MSSLADLRSELRSLRKESVKPVSKMRKADISREIERLRVGREETPAVAATPSSKPRKVKPSIESVKVAKEQEFPYEPVSGTKKGMERKTARKAYEGLEKKKATAKPKPKRKVMVEVTDSESDE